MKIKLMGGLGNQMFQYAFASSYAHRHSKKVYLDNTHFSKKNDSHTYRNYDLDIFELSLKHCGNNFFSKKIFNILNLVYRKFFTSRCIIESSFRFNPEHLSKTNAPLAEGYFQSEKYFLDIKNSLLIDFTFPSLDEINLQHYKKFSSAQSISIHVRRGDYVNNKMHGGICDSTYYSDAINFLSNKVENPIFVVFSDDIAWCKLNLSIQNSIYVEGNEGKDSFRDMQLMSLCKHNIIANSSFSWWGAWLNRNPDKFVVAPKKWFNDPTIDVEDLIPENWIKL